MVWKKEWDKKVPVKIMTILREHLKNNPDLGSKKIWEMRREIVEDYFRKKERKKGETLLEQEEEAAEAAAKTAIESETQLGKVASGVKKTIGLAGAGGGALAAGVKWGAGTAGGKWIGQQAVSTIVPGFWILLSVILYISDLITGFKGIHWKVLEMRLHFTQGQDMIRIVLFGVFIGFLIYLFTRQGMKTREDLTSSLALGSVFALIVFLGPFNQGIFHVVFAAMLYFGLARPMARKEGKSLASVNYAFAILLALDFFLWGFLVEHLQMFGNPITGLNLANRYIFPVWFFYTLYLTQGFEKSMLTKIFTFLVFMVIMFAYIGGVTGYLGGHYQYGVTAEQFQEAVGTYSKAWNNLLDFFATVWDPISCINLIGSADKYNSCIRTRQIARHPELNETHVKGTIDEHLKDIIKVEFVKSARFPSTVQKEFTPRLPIDYILDINAPKTIKIKLSCSYKNPKGLEYLGIIGPEETVLKLEKEGIQGTKRETIFCKPGSDYEIGYHKVIFNAEISELESHSYLTRLFVGKDVPRTRIDELKTLHELKTGASDVGKEFAAFSFNFGNPAAPGEPFESVLDDSPIQVLEGSLENFGKGNITRIQNIEINLIDGIHMHPDAKGCTALFDQIGDKMVLRKDVDLKNLNIEKRKTLPLLKGCYFTVDNELRNPKEQGFEYYKRELSAVMEYSYKLKQEDSFEVRAEKALAGI
jgi:hypothetical protein